MLKLLRNKKLMRIVMWSLVVIFAAWGMGSVAMIGKSYAGTIFGKKISLQEYNRNYSAVLNRARMIYGDQLPKLEKFLNLRAQAWDRIILIYAASKKRLRASNKEVIQRIAGFPFFQRNGVFDKNLYHYITVSVLRTSSRDFEESVRGDIVIDKLVTLVTKDIIPTDDEIKKAYIDTNELADISFIILKSDSYTDDIVVEDAQIRFFYDANRALFISPAIANAVYLEFPFDENKENARFIADEVLAETKKGKTLSSVSQEYSLELKETGGFPLSADVSKTGLPYSLVLASFGVEQGEISDVIEDEDKFYILQIKTKTGPRQLPYEQVKEKTKNMLIIDKASLVAHENAKNIFQLLQSKNSTMENIAKDLGSTVLKATNISRKSYVEDMGRSEDFLKEAFALNVNGFAGPIKVQDGFAIVRLDSVTPINDETYKNDKSAFAEQLTQEKKNNAFQEWFNSLKEKSNLKDNL